MLPPCSFALTNQLKIKVMYNESTTIETLASKGWISMGTVRILSNANITTVGRLGYGQPYSHKWLQVPNLTWQAFDEIIDAFANMDLATAEAQADNRDFFFDRLPKGLQDYLEVNYNAAIDDEENYGYFKTKFPDVDSFHNAIISGPFALFRLNPLGDLRMNINFRQKFLNYLDDEIFADQYDAYAKVRETYAVRRSQINPTAPFSTGMRSACSSLKEHSRVSSSVSTVSSRRIKNILNPLLLTSI